MELKTATQVRWSGTEWNVDAIEACRTFVWNVSLSAVTPKAGTADEIRVDVDDLDVDAYTSIHLNLKHHEDAVVFAMSVGELDWAQDSLNEIDCVENRVYFADKYKLELAECDEEWARRELKAQNDQP